MKFKSWQVKGRDGRDWIRKRSPNLSLMLSISTLNDPAMVQTWFCPKGSCAGSLIPRSGGTFKRQGLVQGGQLTVSAVLQWGYCSSHGLLIGSHENRLL